MAAGPPPAERVLGRVVAANNRRLAGGAADVGASNPRSLDGVAWADDVAAAQPAIRAEWDAFVAEGGRLPHISDLIAEDQGQDGAWRAGLLVSRGRPVGLAPRFPTTLAVLSEVPGLWSALWSVLGPGTELPSHTGPNAGMLRYHLGVVCEGDTALDVDGTVTPYEEGVGVLFDDTAPHAAWNRGPSDRVTLFCEVLRPASGTVDLANQAIQRLLSADPRYRRAPARAAAWDAALNRPGSRLQATNRPR